MIVFFLAIFAAVCTAWRFFSIGEMEQGLRKLPKNGATTYVDPWLLPLWFLMLIPMLILLSAQNKAALHKVVGVLVVELILLCLYYTLLLCVLPLLRRWFSPRACATLWVLPNFLYLIGNIYSLDTTSPLLVLTLPNQWLMWIVPIWFSVFLLILLWQIISHLLYRRYLLQDAEMVLNKDILLLWHNMQARCNFKHLIPIVVSPRADTPLTIGVFQTKMHLVLPHLNYTPEELQLLLSHELRHIQRRDTATKMFIGFCTALCWFNPFMWITRRKVSEDLELSCDELVLSDSDETTRMQYANLLLNTAGNSRGYTTCLSSAATSLRYRLKHVINPRKVLSGTLLVGLVLGILTLSMGTIALADSPGTVQSQIFEQAPSDNFIDRLYISEEYDYDSQRIYGYDEAALTEYLSSLTVRQVYFGNFSEPFGRELDVIYTTEENGETTSSTTIELYDGLIFAYIPYDDMGRLTYMVKEEINWDYIQSLLDYDAPNPDPAPQPPQMTMYFNDDVTPNGQLMYAESTVLRWEQGGVVQEVREWMLNSGVGGVSGYPVTQVQLSFSYAPIQNEYQIRVENWDRTETYTVHSSDLTDNTLELAPYSAHYTVIGRFHTVRDTTYEMEFYFDVELP